jgi:hypothetical protein
MPSVSCIMPTCNRAAFVRGSISYFLRQDLRDAELIIVDDGSEPVQELIPADPRLRYVRLPERRPVGAKRNLACEIACGEVIAHWDDDDWYAPDRLSRQAAALGEAGTKLCGLDTVLFLDVRSHEAWRYVYPPGQRPWLAGNSLMYRRDFWSAHRFPEIDVGEDSRFVWSAHPQDLVALPDPRIHLGVIHDGNVSAKQTGGPWWHKHPLEEIRRLLGEDWIRYAPPHDAVPPEPDPVFEVIADGDKVPPLRNIYACLVHERAECMIDLVRNLHCLDPASTILLYDGGDGRVLDAAFPFRDYGAIRHPAPRPQRWGSLHGFALDCMRYALETLDWDTMTIVDSDQLALRPGFSRQLARHLAGRGRIGMLGNSPAVQPANSPVPPVATALREIELWRPLLRRFPDGESKFVHWTFWPATVFTAPAARDLVRLFAEDAQLQQILAHSAIWATEEVILPTLVALLGYNIIAGPTSYDFVAYRTPYTAHEIDQAMARPDVFWAHPVPRNYEDPMRSRARARFGQYRRTVEDKRGKDMRAPSEPAAPLRLVVPVLERMRRVDGWLEEDEADLLIAATERALAGCPEAVAVVEVGSYLGRATVVLASVVQAHAACKPARELRVHAIDPHDGHVGALDTGLIAARSTPALLRANVDAAGVGAFVEVHHARPGDVAWDATVALLLVDGLHDYANVAQDFHRFEPLLPAGGHVAFHDYAGYFPGVVTFVDELLEGGDWQKVAHVRSMIVLRRSGSNPR